MDTIVFKEAQNKCKEQFCTYSGDKNLGRLCLRVVPEGLIDLFGGDLNSQSEEKMTEAFEQVQSHVFGHNRKAGVSRHQEGNGGMKGLNTVISIIN